MTTTFVWQTNSFQNSRLGVGGAVKKSIVRKAWNYLEDMFINSIVLSNHKLPPSCVSQIPQLHILPHGTGLYNQTCVQHTQTYTHTQSHKHRYTWQLEMGVAKSRLKDIGGQILEPGPDWGQGISRAGKRPGAERPDRGSQAGSGSFLPQDTDQLPFD